MFSRLRIISFPTALLIAAAAGCAPEDTNKKTAISCISGAPVCDKVEVGKLDPDLAKDVQKRLQKQVESKRVAQERESAYKPPAPAPQAETESAPSEKLDANDLVAKASLAIIGACTGWQMGLIQSGQIMDTAKELFAKEGLDPGTVDWHRAVNVARSWIGKRTLAASSSR